LFSAAWVKAIKRMKLLEWYRKEVAFIRIVIVQALTRRFIAGHLRTSAETPEAPREAE